MRTEDTMRKAEIDASTIADNLNSGTTPTINFVDVKTVPAKIIGVSKKETCVGATVDDTCDVTDRIFWESGSRHSKVLTDSSSSPNNLYVIEYLSDETILFRGEDTNVRVFRITVRGFGEDSKAVTTVQSIFMRRNAS